MQVRLLVLVLALWVAGCAFNPQPGMTFDQWKTSAGGAFKGAPELIGMKGSVSVYRFPASGNQNTFYWFDNGRLYQVTQGELPQIRYQIEMIRR